MFYKLIFISISLFLVSGCGSVAQVAPLVARQFNNVDEAWRIFMITDDLARQGRTAQELLDGARYIDELAKATQYSDESAKALQLINQAKNSDIVLVEAQNARNWGGLLSEISESALTQLLSEFICSNLEEILGDQDLTTEAYQEFLGMRNPQFISEFKQMADQAIARIKSPTAIDTSARLSITLACLYMNLPE